MHPDLTGHVGKQHFMKVSIGDTGHILLQEIKIEGIAFEAMNGKIGDLSQHQQSIADVGANIHNGEIFLPVQPAALDNTLQITVIEGEKIKVSGDGVGLRQPHLPAVDDRGDDLLIGEKVVLVSWADI
jgi:hypothetical protein